MRARSAVNVPEATPPSPPLQRSRARESAECRALAFDKAAWDRLQRSRARESAEWRRHDVIELDPLTLQRSRARESAECVPDPVVLAIT